MFSFFRQQAEPVILFSALVDAAIREWERYMAVGVPFRAHDLEGTCNYLFLKHDRKLSVRQKEVLHVCCQALETLPEDSCSRYFLSFATQFPGDPACTRSLAMAISDCLSRHGLPVVLDEQLHFYGINADRYYERDWTPRSLTRSEPTATSEASPKTVQPNPSAGENKWNHATAQYNPLWAQAMSEYETSMVQTDLWDTAITQSGGDEAKAKSIYLRLRVEQLATSAGSGITVDKHTNGSATGARATPMGTDGAETVANGPNDESPWRREQPKEQSPAQTAPEKTDNAPGEHERELMQLYDFEYSNGNYWIGDKEFPTIWEAVQHSYFLQHMGRKAAVTPAHFVQPQQPVGAAPRSSGHRTPLLFWAALALLGLISWLSNSNLPTNTGPPQTAASSGSSEDEPTQAPAAAVAPVPESEWREKVEAQRARIMNGEISVTPMQVAYSGAIGISGLPTRLAERKTASETDTGSLETSSTWWVSGRNMLSLHVSNASHQPVIGVVWHLGSGDCAASVPQGHELVLDFNTPLAPNEERVYRAKLPFDYRSQFGGRNACGVIKKAFVVESYARQ